MQYIILDRMQVRVDVQLYLGKNQPIWAVEKWTVQRHSYECKNLPSQYCALKEIAST